LHDRALRAELFRQGAKPQKGKQQNSGNGCPAGKVDRLKNKITLPSAAYSCFAEAAARPLYPYGTRTAFIPKTAEKRRGGNLFPPRHPLLLF